MTNSTYKLPEPVTTEIKFLTDGELVTEKNNEFVFDVECYPNYFMCGFMSFTTARSTFVEFSEFERLNTNKLHWIMDNLTLIGFNSLNYDLNMLWAALSGFNLGQLNALSNKLIRHPQTWRVLREFKLNPGRCDHYDLQQVAPGAASFVSLKHYAARMHLPKLQELPIEPNQHLTKDQQVQIKHYNVNDLMVTGHLRYALTDAIELRKQMGRTYGVDLRSLSDAQIAERVIKRELESKTGVEAFVPKIPNGTTFRYKVPEYMKFYTPGLQNLLESIRETDFVVNGDGGIGIIVNGEWKKATNKWKIKIGQTKYKLGIGGLHSAEKQQTYFSDDDYFIVDRDVASYYPRIILNQGLYPQHLGDAFLKTYNDIVERRLAAKKAGDKATANSLKITINGSFGKLGSKYSVFFAPDLLAQVTLTGQLSLLMLIEMLEWFDIPVVSANTDGVVIRCPREKRAEYRRVIKDWEAITNFVTEETAYQSIHSRDVNNYFAIQPDGKIKAKGVYTNELSYQDKNREALMSNPVTPIVTEAVMLFLKTCKQPHPKTIDKTIMKCRDLSKFLYVRKVNSGAVKDGVYIGKVIRWYMGRDEMTEIRNAKPNKAGITAIVPDSAGAIPVIDMGPFPRDINYDHYIRKAHSILADVGYYGNRPNQLDLFDAS